MTLRRREAFSSCSRGVGGLFAIATIFAVMFALGLMLGREQIAAALQRRVLLAAVWLRFDDPRCR